MKLLSYFVFSCAELPLTAARLQRLQKIENIFHFLEGVNGIAVVVYGLEGRQSLLTCLS